MCVCVFVFRSFFLVVICSGVKYLPEFLEAIIFVDGFGVFLPGFSWNHKLLILLSCVLVVCNAQVTSPHIS